MPRPEGLSGCETTITTSCRLSSASRLGSAKAGEPKNATRSGRTLRPGRRPATPLGALALLGQGAGLALPLGELLAVLVEEALAPGRGQVVEEQDALEVVVLVLQDVGEVALGLEPVALALQVLVVHHDALGARHVLHGEAGQRQAAVAAVLASLHGDHLGVHDHVLAAHAPGAPLLLLGELLALRLGGGLARLLLLVLGLGDLQGHEEAQRAADLRRGQSDAVGRVHRLDHVGGEALELLVEARHRAGAAPQYRVAVEHDGVDQGSSVRPRALAVAAGTGVWRSGSAWRPRLRAAPGERGEYTGRGRPGR